MNTATTRDWEIAMTTLCEPGPLRAARHAALTMLGTVTFAVTLLCTPILVGEAQAAPCGGNGQKPCPVWRRIPSCDKGLVEDFTNNVCKTKPKPKPIIPRPANCGASGQKPCPLPHIPSCDQGLVEDFGKRMCRPSNGDIITMVKETSRQMGDLLRQTALALGRCTRAQSILNGTASRAAKANSLQQLACIQDLINSAGRAGYNAFYIGIGGGTSFGLGADAEAGYVFDTSFREAPRFYVTYGYSIGIQAGGSAVLVAGFGNADASPGKSDAHGAIVGLSSVGGSGMSAWYNYDGTPAGVYVVGSVGAEFSAAYGRIQTQIIKLPGADIVYNPQVSPRTSISGDYYFVGNPRAVNRFRMSNQNLLQATNLKNGSPTKWHDYVRVNNTTFRARNGTPTYEISANGDLIWKSNRKDKKRIVLRKR